MEERTPEARAFRATTTEEADNAQVAARAIVLAGELNLAEAPIEITTALRHKDRAPDHAANVVIAGISSQYDPTQIHEIILGLLPVVTPAALRSIDREIARTTSLKWPADPIDSSIYREGPK